MHIVFIDNLLMIPPTGGAHTFLVALSGALVSLGHQVSIATELGPEQSLKRSLEANGAEVLTDIWRAVDLPEQRARHLSEWANERGADVLVVSVSPDAGWLVLPQLSEKTATLSIAHSDGPTFYRPVAHYRDFIDCAIGVSEETCRQLVSQCGLPSDRVRRVPYGVETLSRDEMLQRVANTSEIFRVGYVGRLVQSQKRVLDLIPLARTLRERSIRFELHIIGDGPERATIESDLKDLMANGTVKLWGWLSPAEVRQRLCELDAIVLVSDTEGLPVALLEGMAHAAVPVITALPSGNTEVVRNGENGFLVPVGDIDQFAERLALLSRDSELLLKMKSLAWETGQRYTVDKMAASYLECFDLAKTHRATREESGQTPRIFPAMASCVSRYPFWARKIKRRIQLYLHAT
jgi:glycosyltransferase involved in cell wall biosynthesis